MARARGQPASGSPPVSFGGAYSAGCGPRPLGRHAGGAPARRRRARRRRRLGRARADGGGGAGGGRGRRRGGAERVAVRLAPGGARRGPERCGRRRASAAAARGRPCLSYCVIGRLLRRLLGPPWSLICFCTSSSLVCACSAIFLALSRNPMPDVYLLGRRPPVRRRQVLGKRGPRDRHVRPRVAAPASRSRRRAAERRAAQRRVGDLLPGHRRRHRRARAAPAPRRARRSSARRCCARRRRGSARRACPCATRSSACPGGSAAIRSASSPARSRTSSAVARALERRDDVDARASR